VVLLDQRPSRYTEEAFEAAVDVAASVLVASSAHKAPLELRLTDGTVIGGPRVREATALVDHLTGIHPDPSGDLRAQLLALRRARGTSLVVVTGALEITDLPFVAMLRRRFEQLVVVSVDEDTQRDETNARIRFPGVRLVVGADADAACASWNLQVHQ
jgi:hypothetical protein